MNYKVVRLNKYTINGIKYKVGLVHDSSPMLLVFESRLKALRSLKPSKIFNLNSYLSSRNHGEKKNG